MIMEVISAVVAADGGLLSLSGAFLSGDFISSLTFLLHCTGLSKLKPQMGAKIMLP